MRNREQVLSFKFLVLSLRKIAKRFFGALHVSSPHPKPYTLNPNRGFALLITLVVISILLSIGLSLLQITLKQISFSSIARESEVALYAANSAIECMQYHRAQPGTRSDLLNEGSGDWPPVLECADTNPLDQQETTLINGASGVFLYNYWYQYDLSANNTCIEASIYMADMRDATSDIDQDITGAGEGLSTISCDSGEICTTIFARGYNRPCSQLDSLFTVQRELTIEY